MSNLFSRILGHGERMNTDEYAQLLSALTFSYNGLSYGYGLQGAGISQSLVGERTELAPNTFVGLAASAYESNGVVFACMLVRQLVFSSIRFRWQRLRDGLPSDTFGTPALDLLHTPWVGGTTQDLLSRIIQDADIGGNSYWVVDNGELVRLRPDWVDIAVAPRMMNGSIRGEDGDAMTGQVGWKRVGYVYTEREYNGDPVGFLPSQVAHFCPIPDPLALYRGMSWLTPILREIRADQAMTHHQQKFFDNGATPNIVMKHPPGATEDKVRKWAKEFFETHSGVDNAYKTVNLYPGADMEVVGTNLRQIDFKQVRGGGETRIAAAAGVPPVIVGLSEGLAAATYSNYGQARRRFADGTAHPLWQNLSGTMAQVVPPPGPDVRLWYDTTDVPFLREDESDAATIAATKAATISSYITAGYEPKSVVAAVDANDLRLLVHTGLYSVQLQEPGANTPPPDAPPEPPQANPGKEPAKTNGQKTIEGSAP